MKDWRIREHTALPFFPLFFSEVNAWHWEVLVASFFSVLLETDARKLPDHLSPRGAPSCRYHCHRYEIEHSWPNLSAPSCSCITYGRKKSTAAKGGDVPKRRESLAVNLFARISSSFHVGSRHTLLDVSSVAPCLRNFYWGPVGAVGTSFKMFIILISSIGVIFFSIPFIQHITPYFHVQGSVPVECFSVAFLLSHEN